MQLCASIGDIHVAAHLRTVRPLAVRASIVVVEATAAPRCHVLQQVGLRTARLHFAKLPTAMLQEVVDQYTVRKPVLHAQEVTTVVLT